MNIGKIISGAVGAVKRNPALALALVGLFAPKVAAKVAQAVTIAKAAAQPPA